MLDAKYDAFLLEKQEEIRARVLGKYGFRNQELGNQPKRGRVKNEKFHIVCEAFGIDKKTLSNWRRESCKKGRQRLYALLMSLPFDVLEHISKMEIKQ